MHITLIAALTADGFIAKDAQHLSTQWTSKEDARFFRATSQEINHVVVGSATFATFTHAMPGRTFFVYSRNETVPNPYGVTMEVVSQSPQELIARLEEQGVEQVLIAGGASIYTLFMRSGLVNRLLLTHEPVFFGTGVSLFTQSIEATVTLEKIHDLSTQTKVFEYSVSPK